MAPAVEIFLTAHRLRFELAIVATPSCSALRSIAKATPCSTSSAAFHSSYKSLLLFSFTHSFASTRRRLPPTKAHETNFELFHFGIRFIITSLFGVQLLGFLFNFVSEKVIVVICVISMGFNSSESLTLL